MNYFVLRRVFKETKNSSMLERIKNVLIAYVLWMSLAFGINYVQQPESTTPVSSEQAKKDFMKDLDNTDKLSSKMQETGKVPTRATLHKYE